MTRTFWKFLLRPARAFLLLLSLSLCLIAAAPAAAQTGPLNRQQALQALAHADPTRRLEAMLRLADLGDAADAGAVMPRLRDADPVLRQFAVGLVWQLWSRSGDAGIDALFAQGVALMQAGDLPKAVLVFTDIINQRPGFAEAWNKRATIYFMLDQYELSMKDCDAVLARVPDHFGALSGYAQMAAERGQLERALGYMERAHRANPNMANAELAIKDLRRQIEIRRKKST